MGANVCHSQFFRQLLATFISTLACLVILPAALFAVLLFFAASLAEKTGAGAFDAENIDEEAPVALLNISRPIIEGADIEVDARPPQDFALLLEILRKTYI